MRKLPVFRSVGEVFSGVFAHFFQLLRMAWLPIVIWLVISGVSNIWISSADMPFTPEELEAMMAGNADPTVAETARARMQALMPYVYGLIFVEYCFLSIIAVGFHRFVLLGETGRGWGGSGLSVGRPELLYIWSIIKLGLLYVLALIVIALVAVSISFALGERDVVQTGALGGRTIHPMAAVILIVGILALMPVFARLFLVMPHVALGNRSQLREIWGRTQGNGWRLVGYFLVVILTVGIASTVLILSAYAILGLRLIPTPEEIAAMQNGWTQTLLHFVIGIPFWLVWTMLTITMLSVAYREIVGLPGGHEGEATVAEPSPGL